MTAKSKDKNCSPGNRLIVGDVIYFGVGMVIVLFAGMDTATRFFGKSIDGGELYDAIVQIGDISLVAFAMLFVYGIIKSRCPMRRSIRFIGSSCTIFALIRILVPLLFSQVQ